MSIIFFGSPEFAVPTLEALIDAGEMVPVVVTQPDKAQGRGKKTLPCAVRKYALDHGIKTLTPLNMKDEAFLAELESFAPEFFVVVAFGRILTSRLLSMPSASAVNVHASLLPAYRGASPVTWSIMNGETETGVTTMLMDEGLDTGDILLQETVAIADDDTTGTLSVKLANAGGPLLLRTLKGLRDGSIRPRPQGETTTAYAGLLSKEDGHIDWSRSAYEIHNMIRALSPWPSAFCFSEGKRLKLVRTVALVDDSNKTGDFGTVLEVAEEYFDISTGDGKLRVLELQPEGKRPMSTRDFLLGRGIEKGRHLD